MAGKETQHAGKPLREWCEASAAGRRALIVRTAMTLLDEKGVQAVTMRRVASLLGVGAMTLYTYVEGQDDLFGAMVREGFDRLHRHCHARSTLASHDTWGGGARAYVQFAQEHPNIYRLIFESPPSEGQAEVLSGGLRPLLEKVRARLAARGFEGEALEREARREAGRYWIGLHGLAMLVIAGRQSALEGDLDTVLADLIERVAPA